MKHRIVDRRKNPKGKNASNRERFIRRSKEHIRKSINDNLHDRSISSEDGHVVNIPKGGIDEPMFGNDGETGDQNHVITGNTDYDVGDLIERPKQGQGGGGNEGSPDGVGEDDFPFELTYDEYLEILFEGLELPELLKKGDPKTKSYDLVRSGYKTEGTPSSIDLQRTMRRSISRRLALKKPKEKRLALLEEELENTTDKLKRKRLEEQIEILSKRVRSIPYIDESDLRFRDFKKIVKPKHQALMVCLMDVSASMQQKEKDLAKRFFMLLRLFLKCKYKNVDVVFVRHHVTAKECDEHEFFHSRESGGTVISSGMKMVNEIIEDRYPVSDWNIYMTQISDGDNFQQDNKTLDSMIRSDIMDKVQHFYYVETSRQFNYAHYLMPERNSDIWSLYGKLEEDYKNFSVKQVFEPEDVYKVFRELFAQKGE